MWEDPAVRVILTTENTAIFYWAVYERILIHLPAIAPDSLFDIRPLT